MNKDLSNWMKAASNYAFTAHYMVTNGLSTGDVFPPHILGIIGLMYKLRILNAE